VGTLWLHQRHQGSMLWWKSYISTFMRCIDGSAGFGLVLPHRRQWRWTWIDSALRHRYWRCGRMDPEGDTSWHRWVTCNVTHTDSGYRLWSMESELGHVVSEQITPCIMDASDSYSATAMGEVNVLLGWEIICFNPERREGRKTWQKGDLLSSKPGKGADRVMQKENRDEGG